MNNFKLDNEPKIKTGFRTPDGYFESFTERVMQQLAQPEARVIPLYRRKPVWFSAAAAFIVLLGLGIFFRSAVLDVQTVQPDADAIENYLVYQQGINSYDLIQNLNQQDIEELQASIDVDDISNEAIKEYLIDEDVYPTE
jgi:hypothetical protein